MKCVILLALVAAAAASYSSGYASGSTALAPAIKQTSKFNIAATAFTGTTKTLIIKADNKTFKDGCSCTATAARRASCTVTFSTIVPTTMAAATNLTPASLATAMAAAKAADTTLNAVTVP